MAFQSLHQAGYVPSRREVSSLRTGRQKTSPRLPGRLSRPEPAVEAGLNCYGSKLDVKDPGRDPLAEVARRHWPLDDAGERLAFSCGHSPEHHGTRPDAAVEYRVAMTARACRTSAAVPTE